MSCYNKELKIAISIVRKASLITEWFRKKGFESFSKSDESPVTLADFAVQIYVISKLKDYYPNDEIIAEEENIDFINTRAEDLMNQCFNDLELQKIKNLKEHIRFRGKTSERQWTIDPIDGTIGYQKGLSYAVGIGFMVKSIPKVCAIAVPNYNEKPLAIFTAEEGQGAQVSYNTKNFTSIRVSSNERIENLRLCHSLHYDKPWVLNFAKKIGIKNFIQLDSMAKFCMVAEGIADLYLKPLDLLHSFTWDFMPGDLIVKEAGGIVTDLNGRKLNFKKEKCLWTAPGIIASNGILHEKIVELYQNNPQNNI
ncbi:MAG: inositol monophosphatase family protein [Candidatus Hodarchaeota archaeon]